MKPGKFLLAQDNHGTLVPQNISPPSLAGPAPGREVWGVAGQHLGWYGTHADPFLLLCRKLELPLVSGPVEGESFHLPEPELLLMCPTPRSPSPPAVHLGLFLSSSLVSHTHLSLLLFHKSREPRVVVPICLWQQQAEAAALTASGPRPSGRMELRLAPGHSCGPAPHCSP